MLEYNPYQSPRASSRSGGRETPTRQRNEVDKSYTLYQLALRDKDALREVIALYTTWYNDNWNEYIRAKYYVSDLEAIYKAFEYAHHHVNYKKRMDLVWPILNQLKETARHAVHTIKHAGTHRHTQTNRHKDTQTDTESTCPLLTAYPAILG